ncbi:pentapeptide repeat-containing protein [Pelatocladus sp. BLCC-F211]|uniref:pentapeptide repeat-containing protein n=1 Tax=Pelatocladus sp. BLCC-F211 TaxID=3342752 RepID=UPI0035B73EEC
MKRYNSSSLNFANQDLRNRSFQRGNLIGADFSGADIRGCDFSNALLRGANFKQVKAGQTIPHLIITIIVAVFVAIATFHAISQILFNVLGVTPEEPGWFYTIIFFSILGIVTVASAVRVISDTKLLIKRIATTVSGSVLSALLALFYRGITTIHNHPQVGIKTLILSAMITGFLGFYFPRGLVSVAVGVAGTVAAYGFAFLLAAMAFAYLSTLHLVWGLVWGSLCVGAIALVMFSLIHNVKEITSCFATSFRGADLTNANFENAKLGNTDFSKALGYRNCD